MISTISSNAPEFIINTLMSAEAKLHNLTVGIAIIMESNIMSNKTISLTSTK